jgi:acetyl esterase/lipase
VNALQVQCSQCHARFAAKAHLAGKSVKCPKCGAPIKVPEPAVVESLEVRCTTCFTDFLAHAQDRGREVPCPMCGGGVPVGSAADAATASPFQAAVDPLGRSRAPALAPAQTMRSPFRTGSGQGQGAAGTNLLARCWPGAVVVGIGFVSFAMSLVARRVEAGAIFLLAGVLVGGLGVVLPPSSRQRRAKKSGSKGATIASTFGGSTLVVVFIICRVVGRLGRHSEQGGKYTALFGLILAGLAIIVGVIAGYVWAILRFGFFRPTAVLYSLIVLGLPVLWLAVNPHGFSMANLPRGVSVRDVPVPAFPDLGAVRQIAPGVDFQEARLPVPAGQPGHAAKIWVYKPAGSHADHSLPCVLITGAGANVFTGMELSDADQVEHLPYVQAGYAVVAYEIDGYLDNAEGASDQEYVNAVHDYAASQAGMVNARNALEFALAKVREIDPSRLYAAGHSSAAIQSLLLASHDARIKACVAYAPVCDLQAHCPDVVAGLQQIIGGFDTLLNMASPRANEANLRCPVFLFHAQDDSLVPVSQSTDMASRLTQAGKQVKLVTVPFGDHYDSMITQGIPQAIAWLDQFSRASQALAGPQPQPTLPPAGNNSPSAPTGPSSGMAANSPPGWRPPAPDRPANPDAQSPFRPARKKPKERASTGDPVDDMLDALLDTEGGDRQATLKAVRQLDPDFIGSPEKRAALTRALNNVARDGNPFEQREAVKALGSWGDDSSVDLLIGFLDDNSTRLLRSDVYTALAELKDPRAALPVARKIADFFDKADAARCLRALGPAAEDGLIKVAPADDADVCLAAINLLGELGTEKCLPMLRKAQSSKNPVVREAAKMAVRSVRERHPISEDQ